MGTYYYFFIISAAFVLEKTGCIPIEKMAGSRGFYMFLAVALAGNIMGLAMTLQEGGKKIYSSGYQLEKETAGVYEEEFMVSVDGNDMGTVSIQVPEKISEETAGDAAGEEILTEEQRREKELLTMIEEYNLEKDDPDYYYLPGEWEGRKLVWEKEGDTTGTLLSGMFLLAGLLLIFVQKREEEQEFLRRREQVFMDYPGLIMKFTLLVQAGLTVRKAFQKMASDYQRSRPECPRYAYEAIMTACNEMDSGISEAEAYRRFGERCGHIRYKTFSVLLIQNLQKGSRYLADILEQESMEAWDERKRKARVIGETAAMKLLVPMILMLAVVMAIVMIPAFLAFL
ncbi:MAG: type II secretion system F family protein [Clostridiales bacterium]|nr:type II secretion system F family protein [Clostridiales bacterium]